LPTVVMAGPKQWQFLNQCCKNRYAGLCRRCEKCASVTAIGINDHVDGAMLEMEPVTSADQAGLHSSGCG